jgi:OOP family OmpA-OmpF porin
MKQVLKVVSAAGLLLSVMASPGPSFAQVNGPSFTVEPWGGYANFAKNVNINDAGVFGATVGFSPYRYLAVEGHLGRVASSSVFGYTPYALTPPPGATEQDLDVLHYGFDLAFMFRPSAWFTPYVLGGWQEGRIHFANEDSVPKAIYQNGLEFGGGVKIHVASRVAIRVEFRDALWKFPEGTPPPAGTDGTDNQFYTAGVEFALGGKTGPHEEKTEAAAAVAIEPGLDSDHDTVPDKDDQCPNTPVGARVDARGCPIDSDNDGVPDGIDTCPNTPTGAVVDATGCPKDSDNDGVPDGIDQCADTPAGTKVDAKGCPVVTDSDNDGVPDDKDLCPFTQANVKVDKDGCPIELTERETELLDKGRITERNIHFETAKWDILPESEPVLNDIGTILIQWPRLQIEVGGHCDARGSDAYNLDLSEKRANAVLDYLVSHFPQITRGQYSAKGFGERVPVATNKTVEGMAMNRRVEFKVLNTEELTKEKERRRTVQTTE